MESRKDFTNPNKVSWVKEFFARLLSSNFVSKSNLAYFLATAGDIAKFDQYCRTTLKSFERVANREVVFDRIISEISSSASIYEFGVAHGYTTQYFLTRVKTNISYFGFDLFTGLPDQWRNFEVGHFSNGGVPPLINDYRLTWVIGNVMETFGKDFSVEADKQHVILFDLDLLEPTKHVFKQLQDSGIMRSGTILYFDEAFDSDELYIIKNLFVTKYQYRIIARSWSSIAFMVL